MIAYAIYTIITLVCIRSHICSFILRFSYLSIIHIVLYFSRAYIYSSIYSYIPIIRVQVLILVLCHLLLISIILSIFHFYHVFLTCSIYSIRYVFHIFISYLCFMNTSIHISFSIFSLFHAYYIWHFIYLYIMMPMYSHIIHVFLSLYESILLRNWNHSNWIIQTKVMTFSCQTNQFTDFTRGIVCNTNFPVS